MVGRLPMEMAKTVVEVAEVALTAVECCHKYNHSHDDHENQSQIERTTSFDELEALRSENRRIRDLLSDNLKLLQNLADSPAFLPDCPPDLHAHIMASVESGNFLNQLKSLQQISVDGDGCQFPFKEASGTDQQTAEILVNMSLEEPSWWVWVSDDMIPSNVEERSRIDNENYVVVSEESVVDAVANFMAKCVVSNPNSQKLTPEELQKTLAKALSGMSKLDQMLDIWHAGAMFYTLATWGFALVGLYKARAVVRVAAMGVHHSSKLILKAI